MQTVEGATVAEIFKKQSPAVVLVASLDSSDQLKAFGSGFLITQYGLIVTNHHVIKGGARIGVKLPSGDVVAAASLNEDAQRDLAILYVDGRNLPVALLGDSNSIEIGEEVIALGNPEGLEKTVTTGIVSGIRHDGEGNDYIQTTAPISPGSSGGPLLNMKGQVIGVIVSSNRTGQNLNFAIPINDLRPVLQRMIARVQELNAATEARRRAEEQARRKAADEAERRRREEEARRHAAEGAARLNARLKAAAEDAERRREEAEARRRAGEEAARIEGMRRAEAERQRRAAEEEEARRRGAADTQARAEAVRKAEAERKAAEQADAIRRFFEARAREPEPPESVRREADRLWLVGTHAFADKLYPTAQRVLEQFLLKYADNDPRAGEAWLGKARLSQQNLPHALLAFQRALDSPTLPGGPQEAKFWEAETLFRLNRPSLSI